MPVNSGTTFMLKMRNTDTVPGSVNLFFQGNPNATVYQQGRLFLGVFDAAETNDIVQGGAYTALTCTLRLGATNPPPIIATSSFINGGDVSRAGNLLSGSTGYQVKTYLNGDGLLCCALNTLNDDAQLQFASINFDDGVYSHTAQMPFQGFVESATNSQIIIETQPVPVSMIQASQTGSPIAVFSIGIDVTSAVAGMQFSEPITIQRYDLNGNQRGWSQFGVIDPYQPQTKSVYDVSTQGLVLNGQTNLNYTVAGLTSVELNFRYINQKSMKDFRWAVRQRIFEEASNQTQQLFIDSPGLTKHVVVNKR